MNPFFPYCCPFYWAGRMTAHAVGAWSDAAIRYDGWGHPFVMGMVDAGHDEAYRRHDQFIRTYVPPAHLAQAYAYDQLQIEAHWSRGRRYRYRRPGW
jgi:hypothetical protein